MAGETLEVTDAPAAGSVPPPEASPDEIEQQLHVTQRAIADKIGQLEQSALGGIRDTIGMVNDTVSSVQSVVSDPLGAVQAAVSAPIENAAHEVTSTVTNLVHEFDPTAMVRDRPLECVGAATLAGVVAGMVLFARPKPTLPGTAPGLFQTLTTAATDEIMKVGRELIGSVSRSIIERAKTAVQSGSLAKLKGYTV